MIPGSGRSTGEGIAYLLQCSWAFLVAQVVKNPPAMWETWVRSLGWEDALEEGTAAYSRPREFQGPYSPWGREESDMTDRFSLSLSHMVGFILGFLFSSIDPWVCFCTRIILFGLLLLCNRI